jgi:apolipoprotein N-acyltransferase
VQGDIGNLEKVSAETREDAREEILRRYFRLTRIGLAREGGRAPDFAVWPETAFSGTILTGRRHAGYAAVLSEFVQRNGTPLITGALRRDAGTGGKSNSMVFIGRDGWMTDPPYDKTRLLVFGEYVPFSRSLPGVRRWFPWAGNFAPGPGPGIRRIAGIRVGPQICYEGLFPELSRELAAQGAQVFVNVTNDSWFGTTAEPYQHLVMTLARGIEFRRPVVRATNTGISAAMTADGTEMDRSPLQEEWTHLYEIPYRKEPLPTFYQEHGSRLVPAFLWIAAAFLVVTGWRGMRGGPEPLPPEGTTRSKAGRGR